MRITWIGGLHRNEDHLMKVAARHGHELEFHSGEVGGRGAGELRCAIARADLVVICTEVNSHGGVLLAKKVCRQLGRGALVIRRAGPARLEMLLEAIAQRCARLDAAS